MSDAAFTTTIQLLEHAQRGDDRAVDDLFTRYLPIVRQIAALRTGRSLRRLVSDEDIVQEAMLRAFRGLHRFEPRSEGTFRDWLAKCVETALVDEIRAATRKKRGSGKVRPFSDATDGEDCRISHYVLEPEAGSPSKVAIGREVEERIEEILLSMKSHQREVIVLRQLCGMSYREVADAMGLEKEGTARQLCARALAKLRQELGAA